MSEEHGSVWEHFEALRVTFVRMLLSVIIGIALTFYFSDAIFYLLTKQLNKPVEGVQRVHIVRERLYNTTHVSQQYKSHLIPPQGVVDIEEEKPPLQLALLSPLDGIVNSVKIAVWGGIAFTSPLWLGFLLQFIFPALTPYESKVITPFLAASLLFMAISLYTGWAFTLPLANSYFYHFNHTIGENVWSLSLYINYTLALLIGHLFVAEATLVLLFLVHSGIVSHQFLVAKRAHAIVLAFVLGALLTPPDILTQVLMAATLIIAYELAVLYAKLRKRESLCVKEKV